MRVDILVRDQDLIPEMLEKKKKRNVKLILDIKSKFFSSKKNNNSIIGRGVVWIYPKEYVVNTKMCQLIELQLRVIK